MRYAPDINNPFPKPADNGNNQGGGANRMPAFQPGQLKALSSQLANSFGGGLGAWKNDFRNTYGPTSTKPFNFGGGHHNGGGNNPGGNPTPNGPGGGPNDPGGGFQPSHPDHRMAQMMASQQMQQQQQMPMQMPQQGLLNAAPAMNQQQGLLGDIPPEVLAFIRSRGA